MVNETFMGDFKTMQLSFVTAQIMASQCWFSIFFFFCRPSDIIIKTANKVSLVVEAKKEKRVF